MALALPCTFFAPAPPAFAQVTDKSQRIIVREAVPSVKNIHQVSATKTPSGFDVPRYVSLKYDEVNGRQGPSRNHSILWQYRKKGLPVIVIAETEMWRKVRDYKGDESWISRGGLSGRAHVITISEIAIYKKPETSARRVAVAEADMVLQLKSCNAEWCQITAPSGHQGWVKISKIWGTESLR